MLTKFLKPFNEITKALSGSKYPTTSLYYRGVVEVYLILRDDCFFGSKFMEKTIDKMREKFNKYWEEYSMILSIVAVLDPRYKLEIIGWAYEKIYGADEHLIDEAVRHVKFAMERLYEEYKSMPKGDINPQDDSDASIEAKRKKCSVSEKSELDQYFEEPKKPWIKDYDVLTYLKQCESQLPDMARMALDILAIPVSTAASKSSFSAGGEFTSIPLPGMIASIWPLPFGLLLHQTAESRCPAGAASTSSSLLSSQNTFSSKKEPRHSPMRNHGLWNYDSIVKGTLSSTSSHLVLNGLVEEPQVCMAMFVPPLSSNIESSFSAGGRVIDKYRSSLLAKNVEALVCLRDWMYNMNFEVGTDLIEEGEKLSEALGDVLVSEPIPSVSFSS